MPLEIEGTDNTTSSRSEPETVGQTWLDQEGNRIREAAALAVPAAEIALAGAYWNGRREGFNSAREDVLANHPERAQDLPAAIEVDEIRIRQQVLEQEQTRDRSLEVAR
jgi:hypothetical protein